MATFRVRGTKQQTGEAITGKMKAATRERAEEHLRKMGISITEITELPPPPEEAAPMARPRPQPKLEKLEEPDVRFGCQTTQEKPRQQAIQDVLNSGPLRASPEPPPPEAPPAEEGGRIYVRAPAPVRPYSAVATIITILRIVGGVLILFFGLTLLGGIIGASRGGGTALVIAALIALGLALAAVFVVALAELLQMQRDMAQNSARIDERLMRIEAQRPSA